MSILFGLTWLAPFLSISAVILSAVVLSPSSAAPEQGLSAGGGLGFGIGSWVPSVLARPLFNQRPPKPQVTDQIAYAGVRFTYQIPEVMDPDDDDLTYDAVQGAAYNPLPDWLTFDSSTRTFTGRQRAVHIDTYTIRVIVSDGQQSSWAEFSLTVAQRPANLPPTPASLTAQTATEDVAFSYVAPEFSDPDGNTVTYTASLDDGGSLPGWLSFNATSRTLNGTPMEADTPASHTIRITATDDETPPLSSSASFTLTVAEVNDSPVPVADTARVENGGSVDITVAALLANDSDPEGGTLSITAVGGAVNGSVTLSEDGSTVTFAHDGSETTTGSFTYTVSDGVDTATGTVAVTVTEPNSPPVAAGDTASVAEGGEVEIAAATLLSNDTDADEDTLSITAVDAAVNGAVALSEDGSTVTYTHDGSETTTGSFTYTVSDGADTATGTVAVTVTPVNDAPTAVADAATVAEGGEVAIAVATLLANDGDPEGSMLSITAVGGAVNGTVSLSDDKSEVTYTHDGSETTTGSFTYTVSDDTATATGTVAVTVTLVNDAPTAAADTATVAEGGEVEITVATLLANDTDPEGSTLSVTAIGGAVNGTVSLSDDKSEVTYTHDGSETTTGSFTYTVSDGTATGTGTVAVTVTPVNDPPGALSLTNQTATAGASFSYQVPAVTDPDGDGLTYAAFLGSSFNPLPDWLSFDEDTHTFSGKPRKVHVGEYDIQVTVSDGNAAAKKGQFTLTVELPLNRSPETPGLTAQTATEDVAFSYVVPEFDDPDDDTLTYAASLDDGESLPGWLSFNATSRTLSGTPLEADTPASYTIRITATDDGSPPQSSSATFNLTAAEVNDAPTAVADSATVAEGGEVEIAATTLLANDSDPEDVSLSITAVGGAMNGSVTLSEDGSKITFTHDGSETTTGSFTYTVSDGAATATGTVALTVTLVNDAPTAAPDTATVAEGGEVKIAVATLLANDTDPEASTLSVTAVNAAVNGAVALSEDGSTVTYTHDGSESTTGSFTYKVSDGAATATGTVAVTVTHVNDAPTAAPDTATVAEGGDVEVTAATLLANDTDPEASTLSITAAGGAVSGSVELSEDVSKITFTHDGSETTTGSFTYTVSDGTATATGTVAVTVTPVNDAPTAVDDTATVAEGGGVDVSVATLLANDTDPEGSTLSITAAGGAMNGSVTLSEDGSKITFTHDGSETTTGSFTYTVSDGAATATGTVAVTVTHVNDAPTAVDDTATVAEGGEVEIAVATLLANDTDPEASTLSITAAGGAVSGRVELSEDGSTVTYAHDGSETTTGSFTYTVSDGSATATGTVAVTVTPVNDAPTAIADTATVAEGGGVDVSVATLLANDSDAEGSTLSITAVGGAVNGSVTLAEDGSTVTYTHDGSETTTGSFTYTVSDGAATATGTVAVTVTLVNDAPTAVDDTATVAEGGGVDVSVATLLANDTDPEGSTLSITAVGGAVNGIVELSEDGSKAKYTHDGSETTSGSFTYTVSDGSATATGTVAVTVTLVNDAPTAVADTATVAEGGEVEVAVSTLLANDSDPEGSSLSITAVGGAVNGAVALSEDDSTVTYTHDGSETTTGSFTYTVSDGTATATGTVAVTVTPVNDAPTAVDDTATVAEGGGVDVSVATLLANDSDTDGSTLSITAVGGAVNGSVTLSEDGGSVTYTHDGSETTKGSFTYTVSDGASTATGTVAVTVTSVNDAPTAVADTATVAEGGEVEIAVATLLANDTDPEASTLSITAVGGAVNGSVTLSEDGSTVTYTHDGSETTTGSYTYTVSDGTTTTTGSVTLTVTPVNDPPSALTLTNQTATAESSFSYQVPAVTDPDGDNLTYAAFLGTNFNPLPDWLSFDEDTRTFSGKPRKAHVGEYDIQVTVSDGSAASKRGQFTITVVLPQNQPPVAPELSDQTASEDVAFSYAVPEFDDPDDDTVTYAASIDDGGSLPAWLIFNATSRTLSGTPLEANTPASHTIRITATDGATPPLSSSATFTLTVAEVNDPPSAPEVSDQTAVVSRAFSYTIAAVSDPEGGSITYSATVGENAALPSWLSFDAGSRTLSGTPGEDDAPAEMSIRVAATDDGSPQLASSAQFTLSVAEQNEAPQAIDDTANVAEGHTLTILTGVLLANDSDPDGDTLVIMSVGNAVYGSVSLSADGSTVTYAHAGSESSSGSFTYTVSDGAETDNASVSLTITPVNDAPAAPSVADQSAVEDEPFNYRFAAVSDAEGDGVTYTAALAAGGKLPSWLSFNAATRAFSGIPLEADTPATLGVIVTATDDGEPAKSAASTFTLTVLAVNDAPDAPRVADQTAVVDVQFTYLVPAAFDSDSSSLAYAAAQGQALNPLPRWLQFDEDTRAFSGMPLKADVAEHEIVVSVSDDLHTSLASFTLSVEEAQNRPPAPPEIPRQEATEDLPFTYTVPQFVDPDDNRVEYSVGVASPDGTVVGLPAWLAFDDASRVLSGTPREDDTPDVLTIVVTATDDGVPPATAEVRFALNVPEANDPPTARAGDDKTVNAGSVVTLDGSGSRDSEGESLSYAWSQAGGPQVAISGANSSGPTFLAPTQMPPQEELVFTLVVTDETGADSEPDKVRIRVVGTVRQTEPIVPVVTIRAEIETVIEGQVVSFRIEARPAPDRPIAIVIDVVGDENYSDADGQHDVYILPENEMEFLVLATEDDDTYEPDGRIEAAIREQPRYRLGAQSSAHVIVSDNDAPDRPGNGRASSAPRTPTPTPDSAGKSATGGALSFGSAQVGDIALVVGEGFVLVRLPAATGGEGAVSYEISPGLAGGLRFDPNALTISGVPTSALGPTRFTFSAIDESGNRASLTFFMTIADSTSPSQSSPREAEPTPADSSQTPQPATSSTLTNAGTPTPVASQPPPLATQFAVTNSITPTPADSRRPSQQATPSTDTDAPLPTNSPSQSWTPEPGEESSTDQAEVDPGGDTPTGTSRSPEPTPTINISPPPTPTIEATGLPATSTPPPPDQEQGVARDGWLVIIVLAL